MKGDHDELEIFLEICLIPSRIDQKLKNKRRDYIGFKERNWLEIVGDGGDRGGGLHGSWERFLGATLQLRDWP